MTMVNDWMYQWLDEWYQVNQHQIGWRVMYQWLASEYTNGERVNIPMSECTNEWMYQWLTSDVPMVNEWACEVVRWDNILIHNLEKTPTSCEVDEKKLHEQNCICGKLVTMINVPMVVEWCPNGWLVGVWSGPLGCYDDPKSGENTDLVRGWWKKTPQTVRWDNIMIPNLEKTPTSCEVDDKNSTNRLVCVVNEWQW